MTSAARAAAPAGVFCFAPADRIPPPFCPPRARRDEKAGLPTGYGASTLAHFALL